MYIKRLEIQGFKSFVDKVCLEFGKGITSVVGPNGSGKSNIADAVRWVLGEQSVKTLRGGKMEDIIFAGTERRRPVGLAEVALTLDNSDNSIPLDYSEITITRRMYRSGESEYLINKAPCRLKDINELFMDTGVGRDGYSIIGQGRVEDILSSRSEDRRLIFEEASGIMKYKTRKIEAERKLEQTSQNLLRISDIINELEGTLAPLKEQAEVAKVYIDLKEKLKALEIGTYVQTISKLKGQLAELGKQYEESKNKITEKECELSSVTLVRQHSIGQTGALSIKLDELREQINNMEHDIEKHNLSLAVSQHKVSELSDAALRLDGEIAAATEKLAMLAEERTIKTKNLDECKEKQKDYQSSLAELEEKYNSITEYLSRMEEDIEQKKQEVLKKLDLQSDKKTQIGNLKNYIEAQNARRHDIENELKLIDIEQSGSLEIEEKLSKNIEEYSKNIQDYKDMLQSLTKKKLDAVGKAQHARNELHKLKGEMQAAASKHKVLSELEKNLQGYGRSVKEVLNAANRPESAISGIHGALAQLISVPSKLTLAIEMALGGALQNIVTTSEDNAKKAIDYLKKHNLGRATFLPISAVSGKRLDAATLGRLKQHSGFCGVASDLISFGKEYENIVLSLLGRVVIAEDIDAAIAIAREFKYSFKIVTLEGDILSPGGSMSGGSASSKETGILNRNNEIAGLANLVEKLKKSEDKMQGQITQIDSEINDISKEISDKEKESHELELSAARDQSRLTEVKGNISKTYARAEMLRQEKERLLRDEIKSEDERQKYLDELKIIESSIAHIRQEIMKHQDDHKDEKNRRDILQKDMTDCKILFSAVSESIKNLEENISRISTEIELLERGILDKREDKHRKQEEATTVTKESEHIVTLIDGSKSQIRGKNVEMQKTAEEKAEIEEKAVETVRKISVLNKEMVELQQELGKIEVKTVKTETELNLIQDRMWDEYQITYSNAAEISQGVDTSGSQKDVARLKSEIAKCGAVNLSAVEDYEKNKQRYEFMTAQKKDMEQSISKLKSLINELVGTMKEQFMEQFKIINKNFGEVFKELFGGGRAGLVLSSIDNVLESGIEIEVQPPGKKLQNIMLLSGGEKAFTAIALLFAMLKLNAAPFCILDEIEGALDEINVYKFAEYIGRNAYLSQFVVITHKRGTMEVSDTIYGITMQEKGISQIVSLQMQEVAQ